MLGTLTATPLRNHVASHDSETLPDTFTRHSERTSGGPETLDHSDFTGLRQIKESEKNFLLEWNLAIHLTAYRPYAFTGQKFHTGVLTSHLFQLSHFPGMQRMTEEIEFTMMARRTPSKDQKGGVVWGQSEKLISDFTGAVKWVEGTNCFSGCLHGLIQHFTARRRFNVGHQGLVKRMKRFRVPQLAKETRQKLNEASWLQETYYTV